MCNALCLSLPVRVRSFRSQFHQVIVDELRADDGLLALGVGLGVEVVMQQFIESVCERGRLVIALNVDEARQQLICDSMRLRGVRAPARAIEASDVAPGERAKLYVQGGVLFATARTIVVDMLTGKLLPHLVAGILVDNCHTMRDTTSDAFVVREFRRHNRTGFVKGFTDNVAELVGGFAHVEKVMRLLRVAKLFVWPRFRAEVKRDLEARPPEVRSPRSMHRRLLR